MERLLTRIRAYEKRTDRYLAVLKRYVDLGETVLDVGCGSGIFSRALARGNRLFVALDINEKSLRKLSSEYVERICADAHFLPLRDEAFDCILSLTNRASSKTCGSH